MTLLLSLSNQQQAYNFLKDELSIGTYVNVLESSEVKRGIHVGDIKYSFLNVTVNEKMAPDFLSSSKELFEELLENGYRVLSYWYVPIDSSLLKKNVYILQYNLILNKKTKPN